MDIDSSSDIWAGWAEFVGTLRSRGQRRDAAFLAVVPLVLVGVSLLPSEIRRELVFQHTDPTALTAYTSTFVHVGSTHLFVNVVGYLLVVPLAYGLSLLGDSRTRFLIAFTTFLLAFPFVLTGLNLLFVRPAIGLGFSGVLLAFVGYLPFAIAAYADEQFGLGPRQFVGPALFFLGFAVVAVLGVRSVLSDPTVRLGTGGLVAATLLSAALFAITAINRHDCLSVRIRRILWSPGHGELLAVGTVVFVGFPLLAFPADPTSTTVTVNTYVHLLGYALGFMVPYATAEIGEPIAPAQTGA